MILATAWLILQDALAGLGKFDESLGDESVGELVNKAKGYTSPFERDPQNPLHFEIGIELV